MIVVPVALGRPVAYRVFGIVRRLTNDDSVKRYASFLYILEARAISYRYDVTTYRVGATRLNVRVGGLYFVDAADRVVLYLLSGQFSVGRVLAQD